MAMITGYNFEPTTKPFGYVSDAVIDCRLRGIYHALNDKDYFKSCALINDCIRLLDTTYEIDMDKKLVLHIYKTLYNALVELGLNRPMAAHDHIRNLHYTINMPYM
jgi:hypothetical protein